MRIAVFGATGRTGRQVVKDALGKGHSVIAVCRAGPGSAGALSAEGGVEVRVADLSSGEQVRSALAGADAAICAIGPRPPYREAFCAEATRNIVEGMRLEGVDRLVCLTGAMIGDYPSQQRAAMRWMAGQFRKRNLEVAQDRDGQEAAVDASNLSWTIVKPPRLTDGPPRGRYEAGERVRVGLMSSVTRADLAAFMVRAAESGEYTSQRVFIRN
jgi:putative NADH-flavin reductase